MLARIVLSALLLTLAVSATTLIAQTTYPLGQQPAGSISSGTTAYNLGWQFMCNSAAVTVTELGCLTPGGAATTVTLFDTTTTGVIAQAAIPAGTAATWRFQPISPSVQLVNGRQYRIAVMSGGGAGYYFSGLTNWVTTGVIQNTGGVYVGSPTSPNDYPATVGGTPTYGIPDIGYVTGPALGVSANAGTAESLFSNAQGAGGNGVEVGSFTLTSNSQAPGSTWTGIDLTASGTGDDAAAISDLYIYRDDPAGANPGVFDAADIVIGGPNVFTANDGTINFSVPTAEQAFPLSDTRTYFVVVKLAGLALPGETFDFTVSDITVATGTKSVPPNSTMTGFLIDTPVFAIADTSLPTPEQAPLGSASVCQEFTIAYPNGPDDRPASLTVTGLGTADELADLTNTELWWDSDTDGSFIAANDTLIDTQTFNADNGNAVFDLTSLPAFMQGQTRRFFVVYNLGTTASHAETFKCYVSDVGAASLGGTASGLPAPSANGAAGLEVSAGVLIATLNGPTAAATVDSDSQGPGDEGEILCDVTLNAAPGGSWTVTSLTFNAAGTGQSNTAFSELALFETAGTAWTTRAAAAQSAPNASGFTTGAATFTLTNTAFPAGSTRRFFLLGKLNGTAVSGETFNARLESIVGTPPTNGSTVGIPTADSTALMIDASVLTVANGATQPSPVTHKAGTAATFTVAAFRLTATNDIITITGINLTTAGTGDWTSDVDAATGVQVYQDDGDGVFNAADTLLYQGGGAALVTATFGTPLIMPVTSTADLWVRMQLTATAGNGRVAAPETFSLSVANAADVSASTTVLLGTPAPAGVTVGAIEFEVSSFAPPNDLPAGGKAISMSGKGFMTPFTVTIGGVVCPGTPSITGGTQMTGLIVPPGGGQNLAIEVSSGTLATQTLTQTFSYSKVSSVDGGGDSGGSSCAGDSRTAVLSIAALLLLAIAAVVKRRRTA
jgi:hypothetical protein